MLSTATSNSPSHTYSESLSPIIPQDVAARLVIQQRAQCVTIFSAFFAPLDMLKVSEIIFSRFQELRFM